MAQIPNIDTALLLRAASSPSIGQAIQSGTAGLKSGIDIGTALSNQRLKRQKEEMELMKQIQEATAQANLVKEAQTPISTTKTIQELVKQQKPITAYPTSPLTDLNTGELFAPDLGAIKNTEASISEEVMKDKQVPLSSEEMKQAQSSKQERLKGLAIAASPSKYAESLIGVGKTGGGIEQQTKFMVTDPMTGKSKTVSGIQRADGVYHPITNEKVTDLNELPVAGYKVSTRIAGRDPNTDLPVEYNDQTQQYTSGGKPYSGVVFPDLQNAPEGLRKGLQDYRTAKTRLIMITDSFNSFKDKPTGPLTGRYKTMEEWAGTNSAEAARFMSQVRYFQNDLIKAITGAQMSEAEASRLLGQMPTFKDNPDAFAAKLQTSAENIDIAMKEALDTAAASGFAIKKDMLSGEQASAIVADYLGLPKHLSPSGTPVLSDKTKKQPISSFWK